MDNIQRYETEPIVIITQSSKITTETINDSMAIAQNIGKSIGEPYVVIVDVRESDSTYGDMMNSLAEIYPKPSASFQPEYIVCVGSKAMMNAFRQSRHIARHTRALIPMFADLDHALMMARRLLRINRC